MPIAVTKLRFSWIALAAFVGTSLVGGDASAACASMPDAGGCQRGCCCCETSNSPTPIRPAAPVMGGRHITSQTGNVCQDVPGCHCRPPVPTAPKPKEWRAEESRPDSSRSGEASWLEIGDVFRPFTGPVPPTSSPPRKSPLYLCNSRFLI